MRGRGEIIPGRRKSLCKVPVVDRHMCSGNCKEAGVAGDKESRGTWHETGLEGWGADRVRP